VPTEKTQIDYPHRIKESGLSIYAPLSMEHELWIPRAALESLLNAGLHSLKLTGLPNRTRSKVIKTAICKVLGYTAPKSFKKTKPRFPCQQFDVYGQKSNNLQIWNEEVAPNRRYVLVGIDDNDTVQRVRVLLGEEVAKLDNTGTLTGKFQARFKHLSNSNVLTVARDSDVLSKVCVASDQGIALGNAAPTDDPEFGRLLPIAVLFSRLSQVVGKSFPDPGADQERLRGAALHKLVADALGYTEYADDGQFPDIRHQLIEVKLQASQTIDLGLVSPDSTEALDMSAIGGVRLRHCDVRYAVFGAEIENRIVTVTRLVMSTGERFFESFPKFGGLEVNKKLQIPLPEGFFAP